MFYIHHHTLTTMMSTQIYLKNDALQSRLNPNNTVKQIYAKNYDEHR